MINISLANSNLNKDIAGVDVINTSQQLLLQAKTHPPTESLIDAIKNISEETLQQLKDDDYKKAFWLNIYNAYTQIILSKNPGEYKKRSAFFNDNQINIAGIRLSQDDIEHGILRHSKIKWSLGYLNKLFSSAF